MYMPVQERKAQCTTDYCTVYSPMQPRRAWHLIWKVLTNALAYEGTSEKAEVRLKPRLLLTLRKVARTDVRPFRESPFDFVPRNEPFKINYRNKVLLSQ